ncbi:MAG: putative lipid II flippase FtsW [Verrucomicrobiales bacterium]
MRTAIVSLILTVGALLAFGLIMLYSSSMVQKGAHYLILQFLWCGIGLVLCLAASLCDYRHWKKALWVLLPVVVILLVLVLIPGIGVSRNGGRRWFNLGFAMFQPSEIAKITLILAVAYYGHHFQRHMREFWKGLVIPCAGIGVILVLIAIEPDRGTALLLAAVSGSMMLLAGIRWIYLGSAFVLLAGVVAWSLQGDTMRLNRLFSYWNPEATKSGVGYQTWQAMLAFGAGGVQGLGLGNGRQKFGFIPEHHTDFIFSVIGEEMGMIACLAIIILFISFVVCGIFIACKAPDTFGFLTAAGITLLIGLQAFINIGVVTSALPNKGLPLPFISYGGSNLALMLMCVGMLVSIARQAHKEKVLGGATYDEPELVPA